MEEIVIMSDRPQKNLEKHISAALRSSGASLPLRFVGSLCPLHMSGGVLVIKDMRRSPQRAYISDRVVVVTESGCEAAVETACRFRLKTVICGMSPRDTVIAESITPERCIICLQRSVPSISGGVTREEAMALSTAEPCPTTEILLTAGTLFVCGQQRNELFV